LFRLGLKCEVELRPAGPKRRYYFVGLTTVAERVGSYIGSYSWSNDVFNTLTGGSIGQVLWRRTGGSTVSVLNS